MHSMTTTKRLLATGGRGTMSPFGCDACEGLEGEGQAVVCPSGYVLGMCQECKSPMWMARGEAALQAVDHLLCGVVTTTGADETCAVVYESEEDCFFWGDGLGIGFEDDDMQHPFVVVKAPPHKIVVGSYPDYMDLFEMRGGAEFFEFSLDDAHLAAAKVQAIIDGWRA